MSKTNIEKLQTIIGSVERGDQTIKSQLETYIYDTEEWRPISIAPGETLIQILGDSGYVTTPYYIMLAKFSTLKGRFLDIHGDAVSDGCPDPTHWRPYVVPTVKDFHIHIMVIDGVPCKFCPECGEKL